jgi:hypothetical protein
MSGGRAVEPFEPILIEKRGERRLAESCFAKDPEERGCRLVLFALERRQDRVALRGTAVERVGRRSEPELDAAAPLGRSERKMRDLVQNDIGFGPGVERGPVPIEMARGSLGVDGLATKRRATESAARRSRSASPPAARSVEVARIRRTPYGRAAHKAVEGGRELPAGYRAQDHLTGRRNRRLVRAAPAGLLMTVVDFRTRNPAAPGHPA